MRGMATLPQVTPGAISGQTKVGRPQVSLALANLWNVIFSFQCFDTVGWVTGRASGL